MDLSGTDSVVIYGEKKYVPPTPVFKMLQGEACMEETSYKKRKPHGEQGLCLWYLSPTFQHEDFNEVNETEDNTSQQASIFTRLEPLIEREG